MKPHVGEKSGKRPSARENKGIKRIHPTALHGTWANIAALLSLSFSLSLSVSLACSFCSLYFSSYPFLLPPSLFPFFFSVYIHRAYIYTHFQKVNNLSLYAIFRNNSDFQYFSLAYRTRYSFSALLAFFSHLRITERCRFAFVFFSSLGTIDKASPYANFRLSRVLYRCSLFIIFRVRSLVYYALKFCLLRSIRFVGQLSLIYISSIFSQKQFSWKFVDFQKNVVTL